jgi:ABC-type branched-subunit amino acid transport system ATPase component/ABC-type branched-subunit amino acid transport system permease subunit
MHVLAGLTINESILTLGLFSGLSYALLAVGLLLVYRATRVINFAHGEIGAFGAAVLAKLVIDGHWNFFAALAVALLVGGALGAAVEWTVVRRLFDRPRFVLTIGTIGVAQILFFAQLALPKIGRPGPYPTPIDRVLHIGDLYLRSEHFMVLAFAPAAVAGVMFLLNRTPYGLAIRACAENSDAAQMAGVSTRRISLLVWTLGGVLATLTVVLVNPLKATVAGVPTLALGPGLLLRALVAVLVGRFVSLPWTVAGGIGVGVLEALLYANVQNPGATDMALLVLAAALVFWRGKKLAVDHGGSWFDTARTTATSDTLRSRRVALGAAVVAGLALPLVASTSSQTFLFSRMLIFALAALSVTVLTGWAGQLSLGQFAFVGLGAMTTAALVGRGMPFGIALVYATVATAMGSVAIGAPALRVRGPLFAVLTLAFAVAANAWIFNQSWFLGDRTLANLPRGALGPFSLGSQRAYYYLCLVVVSLVAVAVGRLRRTGVGRAIIAVRDNEHVAASFTVSPQVAKLTAFGLAGALAGLAGGLLAGLLVQFGSDSFRPDLSFLLVAIAVIGGLSSARGAVLGSIFALGVPAIFDNSLEAQLLTSGAGLLLLLLLVPGGLAEVVDRARLFFTNRFVAPLGTRKAPPDEVTGLPLLTEPHAPGADDVSPNGVVVLSADDVVVRFGGLAALDGVTVTARKGEVVGLMGTNGAGKSTLMDVIGGYTTPAAGKVALFGEDVTDLPAFERARRGVGRVFQDARLFTELTVSETIRLALEHEDRAEVVPSLLALGPSRRGEDRKHTRSSEIIDLLKLGDYAETRIGDLSTGTRRIVELAAQIALGSRMLLLDEPTAGVAQKDAEAFGPLIKRVQRELGATVVLIEHDLPLVMSVSDRVYCLGAGKVIATGSPDAVRSDPAVIASYLGTDDRAILRSGKVAGARR